MGKNWGLLLILTLALVGLAGLAWCFEEDDLLPEFSVVTFEGEHLSRADFLGHPLMVVFWTTWCPNCKRDLPGIKKASAELGPRGLRVLAINAGINDSEARARAYQKEYGLNYPIAFDHEFEATSAFGIWGVPTVILVDVAGRVRYRHPLLPKDMEAWFEKLSKGGNEK